MSDNGQIFKAVSSAVYRYITVFTLSLIAVIGIFYLFTMREGHDWGDDFGLYLLHAKSIAEGRAYGATEYLHNALYADISPKAFPPVLAIVLAPIYKWLGLNLSALKITVFAFFLATLWVVFLMYRTQLPAPYAAGTMLLLGFNPVFWNMKDEILSDLPFMFFVYVTLWAVQAVYDANRKDESWETLASAILIGVLVYLAYCTRTIGAVLIPSLFVYDLVKVRRISRFAIIVLVVAGVLIVIQALALPEVGSGYVQYLKEYLTGGISSVIMYNMVFYLNVLSALWDNGYDQLIKNSLCIIVSVCAAVGLGRRIRNGVTINETFLLLYIVVILLYLTAERFLSPIIPLYFMYASIGAIDLSGRMKRWGWQYAPLVVACVVVLSYASKYTTMHYGPLPEGIGKEESQELFQYLKEHTQPQDILIFRKPRALALLTGRQTSIYPKPSDDLLASDRTAWNYFHRIGAGYLVVGATAWARNSVPLEDVKWERHFVERYKDKCEEVFQNGDFRVYKVPCDN